MSNKISIQKDRRFQSVYFFNNFTLIFDNLDTAIVFIFANYYFKVE